MHCLEASEAMSLRLDTDLGVQQEQALQEHLAVCEHCRCEWEWMQQADALFANVNSAAPPPLFTDRVMSRLQRRVAWRSTLRAGMISILVLAVLGIVSTIIFSGNGLWTSQAHGTWNMPPFLVALVGVLARFLDITGTILKALGLALEGLLAGPNYFLVIGYLQLAGGLMLLWMRFLSRHLRPVDEPQASRGMYGPRP